MSLLRDMIVTIGDALRLSNDLMRYKLEAQTRALKRTAGRLALALALMMAAGLLAGAGAGFLLYGIFVLIASATGAAAAGLILGVALFLVAMATLLIGRAVATRRRTDYR